MVITVCSSRITYHNLITGILCCSNQHSLIPYIFARFETSIEIQVKGDFICSEDNEVAARKLPLGIGAVESLIPQVVNLRMKGNNKFWLQNNAEI